DVSGPDLVAEGHLEAPDVGGAGPVGEIRREQRGVMHALGEDAVVSGVHREVLVEMDRVEVSGCSRIAHEHLGREGTELPCRQELPSIRVIHALCLPSLSIRVARTSATTRPPTASLNLVVTTANL